MIILLQNRMKKIIFFRVYFMIAMSFYALTDTPRSVEVNKKIIVQQVYHLLCSIRNV